jgi:AraC-like DNA-binding protein
MAEAISESVHATPGEPLAEMVVRYDGYRQRGVAPARHLGLPSPYLTVIVTLDEPLELAHAGDAGGASERFRALIGGLSAAPVVVSHAGAQSGIQLSVSPLASRALFGVPAGELAGLDLPAEAVLGAAAGELFERVGAAAGWSERFGAIDAVLSDRVSAAGQAAWGRRSQSGPPSPVRAAWNLLRDSGGAIQVAKLAREVGWSERQLEKSFRREIGMAPKQAARVIRFDRARRDLQARARGASGPVGSRPLDLARLAAECGYHDQPHLIRDFRSFTGLAPTRWLAQEFGNVQGAEPVAT